MEGYEYQNDPYGRPSPPGQYYQQQGYQQQGYQQQEYGGYEQYVFHYYRLASEIARSIYVLLYWTLRRRKVKRDWSRKSNNSMINTTLHLPAHLLEHTSKRKFQYIQPESHVKMFVRLMEVEAQDTIQQNNQEKDWNLLMDSSRLRQKRMINKDFIILLVRTYTLSPMLKSGNRS